MRRGNFGRQDNNGRGRPQQNRGGRGGMRGARYRPPPPPPVDNFDYQRYFRQLNEKTLELHDESPEEIQRVGNVMKRAIAASIKEQKREIMSAVLRVDRVKFRYSSETKMVTIRIMLPANDANISAIGTAYDEGNTAALTFFPYDRPQGTRSVIIPVIASMYSDVSYTCVVLLECHAQKLLSITDVKRLSELKDVSCQIAPYGALNNNDLSKARDLAENMIMTPAAVMAVSSDECRLLFQASFHLKADVPESAEESAASVRSVLIPSFLTPDQQEVVRAVLNPENVGIVVNAPAGAGKTTTIVEAVLAVHKSRPDDVPLVTSTTNAAIIHAGRMLMEGRKSNPLIFLSASARKALTKQEKAVLKNCTLMAHYERLLSNDERKLNSCELVILRKAIAIELKMEEEVEAAEEKADSAVEISENLGGNFNADDEVIRLEGFDYVKEEKTNRTGELDTIRAAINLVFAHTMPSAVIATVSMTFRYAQYFAHKTKTIFIDEASTVGQMILPALLTAFIYVRQVVLVGDPKQLGTYTKEIPDYAVKFGFESALNVLMANEGTAVKTLVLTTNFRSHPDLVDMIRRVVYLELNIVPFSTHVTRSGFPVEGVPVRWIDVHGPDKLYFPTSRVNESHTAAAAQVIELILNNTPAAHTIGVICLYSGQKKSLLRATKELRAKVFPRLVVASVDSFQGREADYVILVTTLAEDATDNTFFSKMERFNVALTRARRGLIVIASSDALRHGGPWATLHDFCDDRFLVDSMEAFVDDVRGEVPV